MKPFIMCRGLKENLSLLATEVTHLIIGCARLEVAAVGEWAEYGCEIQQRLPD